MTHETEQPAASDVTQGDEFLTVDEVASLLKVNPQTVRNRIDAGEVPAIRFGRRVRIQRSALEQLIGSHRGGAAPLPWQPSVRDEPLVNTEAVASVIDDIAFDFACLAAIVRGEQPPVKRRRSK